MNFENECQIEKVEKEDKEQQVQAEATSRRRLFVCWREVENKYGEENKNSSDLEEKIKNCQKEEISTQETKTFLKSKNNLLINLFYFMIKFNLIFYYRKEETCFKKR